MQSTDLGNKESGKIWHRKPSPATHDGTLSALAHWSAIFSDTPYLPLLAFPFVKLFQNNQLICFEVVATLIINWCQHWFEYFPNPPINILSMIENVLAFHDKELLQHFIDRDITSQVYAWPLLETLFSEVLTREEWLRLFDNIFSNHPSFLLMTVVAYSTCSRAPLLNCTLKNDFEVQMRDQEIAATAKDLEIRQLELEAQKRLYEKWKEAEEKEFHLQSAKKASALSDASRKWFLRQETSAALEHEEMPWLQRQYMDSAYLPQTSRLHDVSDMDPSTHIFSRNYPTEWNHMEHDLLKNVRDLRRRLTARARNSCRHPHLLVT